MGSDTLITSVQLTHSVKQIGRKFCVASLKVSVTLSLLAVLLSPQSVLAQAGTTLGTIEQKLFFKTYADESDDSRLARVEKQLFGQQMEGAFQDRLKRVMGAASPQTNPDGSVSGMGAQQSAGTANSTKAPTESDLKQRAEDERQAAMDRARVAVEAARDEQTNKLIETGVSLWRAKRGTEALGYFDQALKADPHNANALYYAGIVYESKKSYVEALASYRKAANEEPANQEYSDAVLAVQKLMKSRPAVDPRQAEISKLATEAGEAYKRGEYLSALDLYKQLDQKAPNQALVKYNLGSLYLHAGQFATALDYFHAAVQLRPTDQKFQQAYQQLKANVDRADAVVQGQEAQFNNAGMNGAAGAGGMNGQSQQPHGREALNMGAQNRAGQNGGTFNGSQQGGNSQPSSVNQQSRGGNDVFSNPNSVASAGGNSPQNSAPKSVAIPPGTGHEPGYAPPRTDGNAALQRWAQTQNKSKPKGASVTPASAPQPQNSQQQQIPQQQQNAQQQSPQQQSPQQQMQQAPQQSSQPDFGSNQNQFSSQNQNQFSAQPQPVAQSQVPPGQHPLIHHPLKGSKSVTSSSAPSHSSSFPSDNGANLGRLQQPSSNPVTELGILATNGKNGVTITHVGIASRASRAGLLQGDIIRAVDNKVVSSMAQVTDIISKKGSGASIELHIQRKDQLGTVHL